MKEPMNYPITIRVAYFREHSDTRDIRNQKYVIEKIVNSHDEEFSYYESLCHESNIVIEKL